MINFLKYRWSYLTISLLVLVPGVYSLITWGLKPSIDFVGGSVIEAQISNLKSQNVVEKLEQKDVEIESVHEDGNVLTIRTKAIERAPWEEVKPELASS